MYMYIASHPSEEAKSRSSVFHWDSGRAGFRPQYIVIFLIIFNKLKQKQKIRIFFFLSFSYFVLFFFSPQMPVLQLEMINNPILRYEDVN